MNHFISITSNGGYIGRIAWINTGVQPAPDHWGGTVVLSVKNIMDSGWWGECWVMRALTR